MLDELDNYDFSKVYLFLDNDTAGRDCIDFYKQAIEGVEVVDNSALYKNYSDFNEMLIIQLSLIYEPVPDFQSRL